MSPTGRSRAALTPWDTTLIGLLAAASAIGALQASAAPSGVAGADALFRAASAALVTLATARARRWTWLVLAAVATAGAKGPLLAVGAAASAVSFIAATQTRRFRLLGAVVGALSVQVLLRQGNVGFHGASALIALIGVLPVLVSAYRRSRSPVRRRCVLVAGAMAGLFVVATMGFGLAMLLARRDLEAGARHAKAALAAARNGRVAVTEQELSKAGSDLAHSSSLTGAWWARAARAVPVVGHQAEAVELVTAEARRVVRSAQLPASLGELDRLKYQSGRFDMQRISRLQRPIADSAATLIAADGHLSALNRGWLLGPLRHRMDDFDDEIRKAASDADLASAIIDQASGLLGAKGTRHYFVAFITPAELRGAGGFIGNYGELTAVDGRVRLTRTGPIRDLVNAAPSGARRLLGPADYLRRYGAQRPADYFQDLTFSPHFPFDADAIEQLYPQSGGQKLDGVISIDPTGLAALLRFTGPIVVPGLDTPLTSANAADILLRQQYIRFGNNLERKDLLVEASRITFERLTTGSLPAPRQLAKVLGPMVRQRHIMLHSPHPSEQRLFRRIHADGGLPPPQGDVVAIASQNTGNNKIDTFLHRHVDYDTTVNPGTGRTESTATVTLRNDAPAAGLPDIVIGNTRKMPPGTNLMTLSFYSRYQLIDATLDGRPLATNSAQEARLRVYSARLVIPPHSTQVVRLRLAGSADLANGYQLTTSPQPIADADSLAVTIRATHGWRLAHCPPAAPNQTNMRSSRQLMDEVEVFHCFFQRAE